MKHVVISCLLLFSFVSNALAQQTPNPDDVSTLDGIIQAYYEVVSGPAGQERDWARDSTLHLPGAQVLIVRNDSDGNIVPGKMSLGDYHESSAGISEVGFFEYEIHRETMQHGAVAHVWSTYEWREKKSGPIGGKGINSIQLVHDGKRWWITSWMFDGRTNAPEVPKKYLPNN